MGIFGAANIAMPGLAEAVCQRIVFAEVEATAQLVEKYAHEQCRENNANRSGTA